MKVRLRRDLGNFKRGKVGETTTDYLNYATEGLGVDLVVEVPNDNGRGSSFIGLRYEDVETLDGQPLGRLMK
jgi:hypothetical protein